MSRSNLIIPAPEQPVTVEELAIHTNLGSDYADQESDIGIKLAAAISVIEEATGRRQLCEATWELRLCHFPCEIDLDVPQVSSVESIKYTDAAGVEYTISASDYKLVGGYDSEDAPLQVTDRAKIVLNYGKCWPTAILDSGEPVVVRYVAGFADAASVPYPIKAAIMLEAGHLYANRESVTVGNTAVTSLPLARGVDSLIAPYRVWGF